jgi:hypothetical protein
LLAAVVGLSVSFITRSVAGAFAVPGLVVGWAIGPAAIYVDSADREAMRRTMTKFSYRIAAFGLLCVAPVIVAFAFGLPVWEGAALSMVGIGGVAGFMLRFVLAMQSSSNSQTDAHGTAHP